MQNIISRPQLQTYDDYRAYLRDYAAFRKAKNSGWSYSVWARSLGLQSKSALIMVMRGQRPASKALIKKLVSYFQFSDVEESYFQTLVRISGKRQIHVHEAPRDLQMKKAPAQVLTSSSAVSPLTDEEADLLTQWQTFVAKERALINAKSLTTKENLSLLATLVKSGLLKQTDDDHYVIGDGAPEMRWTQDAVRRLHSETLEASRRALDECAPDERVFRLSFLRMKKSKMAEAIMVLRQFQKDFTDAFEDENGDEVFELNLHYFLLKQSARDTDRSQDS